MSQQEPQFQNQLLSRLSPVDLALLGPLERLDLPLRHCLEAANRPIEFVYFIEEGVASIVANSSTMGSIELGIVGREGMTGLPIISEDTQSPFETFMQVPGSGIRIPASRMLTALAQSPALRTLILRYGRSFAIQVSTTAFANGRSKVEERLARWLLMIADRTSDRFHITHEFLATMLAVRRSGVTIAMQSLEGRHLIRATRGAVAILDRKGLVGTANGSYGLPEREYVRLLA